MYSCGRPCARSFGVYTYADRPRNADPLQMPPQRRQKRSPIQQDIRVGRSLACAYATTASRMYLTGTSVMLHSLFRLSSNEHDCETLFMLWHHSINDSVLPLHARHRIDCLADQRRVVWHSVSNARIRSWSRCPTGVPISSFLRLELFYLNGTSDIIIFLDADMLVMRPLSFVVSVIRTQDARVPYWRLHGSSGAWGARQLNVGFLAFQPNHAKGQSNFTKALDQVCDRWSARNRTLRYGDMDMINEAIKRSMPPMQVHLMQQNKARIQKAYMDAHNGSIKGMKRRR
jgi:hypothetical protein